MFCETSCQKNDYTIWKKLINFILYSGSNSLSTQLGPCIIKNNLEWTQEWDWFVTNSKEFIYYKETPLICKKHLQIPYNHNSCYNEFST